MQIDTSSTNEPFTFTFEEVEEASKICNFNKGLGPDCFCFDGNLITNNDEIGTKILYEIVEALN